MDESEFRSRLGGVLHLAVTERKRSHMHSIQKSIDDDEEDYWGTSRASTDLARGVNVFDENVTLDATKRILRSCPEPVDFGGDNDDTINWDGSSSSSSKVEFKSARYRSTQIGDSVSLGPDIPTSKKPVAATSISNEVHSRLSSPSIDDVVGSSTARRQPTLTEISKMESEISFLKRSLEAAKNENLKKVPVSDTIRRIILGQPYTLEKYKSKEDKLQLLDEAISSHDGNAITIAVLFFRDTMKAQIFNIELILRPRATEHYLNHLRQLHETDKLVDFLGMLGRNEEAAMLKYRQALAIRNVDSKLKSLKLCHQSHFQSSSQSSLDSSLITEQISLIERQLPIEMSDARDAERGAPIFKELPRSTSVTDTSVITTLFYCCLYHYELPENNLASPQAIRKAHRLTEKQYTWTAMCARARLRRWNEIDALFMTKGWLGGTKMKSIIGFDRVVALLHKLSAPRDILNKYCNLIDALDRRLAVGQKYNCCESVIETYMNLKDRLKLITYQSQLKVNSPEWFHAETILKNSSIKWKN